MRGGRFAECLLVPLSHLYQRVVFAEFQRENGVPKVVPVNDQIRLSEEAGERCDCEGRNGGWVLRMLTAAMP